MLDLMLPDGDGLRVLEHVRNHAMDTRVIILTGVDDPRRLAAAKALRPVALLKKPVEFDDLLRLMA